MDRVIHPDRVILLTENFEKSLRGKVTARTDIQKGLILLRKQLETLSFHYDRNVLHLLCYHFLMVLMQKLFYQTTVKKIWLEIPEQLQSLSQETHRFFNDPQIGFMISQVMAEVGLAPFERDLSSSTKEIPTFVEIPHYVIQEWYILSMQENLKWREALVYLGTRLAISHLGKATRNQIYHYVSLPPKTIGRHLKKLTDIGLLHFKSEVVTSNSSPSPDSDGESYSTKFYTLPPSSDRRVPIRSGNIMLETKSPWFADLNPFANTPEEVWASYTPWMPNNSSSPIIQVGYDRVDAHERSLSAVIVMAGCFNKEQIFKFLEHSHGNNYRERLKQVADNFMQTIADRFTIPERLHPHYNQISKALPLLMYASRRRFEVDFQQLLIVMKTVHTEIKLACHDLKVVWNAQELFTSYFSPQDKLQWDISYFLACFLLSNPYEKWKKRYPDSFPLIPIGMPDQGTRIKWVTLDKDWFKLDQLELLQGKSDLADAIIRVVQLLIQRRTLRELWKGTLKIGTATPRAQTKTFDNASHRMYFVGVPRQGVSKQLRPLFKAKSGHQFLIVDIKQTDLQLWKAIRNIHSHEQEKPLPEIDFYQIAEQTELTRDIVKNSTYRYFYGAGRTRIMRDFQLTQDNWSNLYRLVYRYFNQIRNQINAEAKRLGHVHETPLGYKIPINRKYYRAASLYAQAIGAEILREWVINLHKVKLSPYIVNLIHDEIIFELPVSMNLYDVANQVQMALKEAARTLLPSADLQMRASATRRWGSDAKVTIRC